MNELEQQIADSFGYNTIIPDREYLAKQAAKIAMHWIKIAWEDGSYAPDDKAGGELRWDFNQFKNENNLTEQDELSTPKKKQGDR